MNPVQRPLENVFKHVPIIMDLAVDSVINAIDTCTLENTSGNRYFQYLMSESLYTYVKRVFYPSLRLEAAAVSI